MAHFAEIGLNNTVLRVIVVHNNELLDENGVEQELKGVEFCRNLFGGTWIQTSYNGNFRKRYAGAGYTYNSELDAFIAPKPFNSWIFNTETTDWDPPTPRPEEGLCFWNEDTLSWDQITL